MTNSEITFGSINVETGETEAGFLSKGKMKFKKQPWWRRLFSKPPRKKEYVGDFDYPVFVKTIFGASERVASSPIFKECNPFNGEVYSIYTCVESLPLLKRVVYFHIDSFVKNGIFVVEKEKWE